MPRAELASSSKGMERCLVLRLPRKGYSRGAILHVGVAEEAEGGVVHELHRKGVRRRIWREKNGRKRFVAIAVPGSDAVGDWDAALREHSVKESGRCYDGDCSNCLDYVVRFLNATVYCEEPRSRHNVSGILLAPVMGRIQMQQQVGDKLSTPATVLVIHLPFRRNKIAREARGEAPLVCDACSAVEGSVRSCRGCRAQVCCVCVYLHICET